MIDRTMEVMMVGRTTRDTGDGQAEKMEKSRWREDPRQEVEQETGGPDSDPECKQEDSPVWS